MQVHGVVDQIRLPIPLDPLAAAFFLAVLVAVAVLTARRPSYGLIALVVAIPFAFGRDFAGTTITVPKAALVGVLLGLTTYGGSGRRLREYPALQLLIAFGAYFVATALTLAVAAHPAPVVRESLKVAEYAAFLGAAYLCYRLDDDDRPIADAVAIATIAVSLTAIAQEAIGAPSSLCIGAAIIPRIAGVLDGPNQLAGYFEVTIAVLGAWSLRRGSALVAIALGLAVCADVLTFSRAGLLGLGVVLATVAALAGRTAIRRLWPALAGAVAGAGGVAAWGTYAHTADMLRLSLDQSLCAGGVGNRAQLWPAAWRAWWDHPILGIGAGNFELELWQYGVFGVRTHANSWYLQSLAEGGLLLFAATVGLVVTILTAFGRWLRQGSPWVLSAFAASLALALHQIVDYLAIYPKIGATWCVLLGIGAGAIAAARDRK